MFWASSAIGKVDYRWTGKGHMYDERNRYYVTCRLTQERLQKLRMVSPWSITNDKIGVNDWFLVVDVLGEFSNRQSRLQMDR